MKKIIILIAIIFSASPGWTQNIDSVLASPQVLQLSISTPQPRLKETFKIGIDVSQLTPNIFKSLSGKVQPSNDLYKSENKQLEMNVHALEKGRWEIGPVEFYLDKTKYTTNKIVYEVVDPLPDTDNGLWFRKVMTSDSSFCIIIEQRIPRNNSGKKSKDSDEFTTEPDKNMVQLNHRGINGTNSAGLSRSTTTSGMEINGQYKSFLSGYSIYYFDIEDKKAKIRITKADLSNLPANYKFEDIVIQ